MKKTVHNAQVLLLLWWWYGLQDVQGHFGMNVLWVTKLQLKTAVWLLLERVELNKPEYGWSHLAL